MAPLIAYTLPTMQLVCNLVIPEAAISNATNAGLTGNELKPGISSAILPEGYVVHPDVGTAYKVYNESLTWKGGRERCIAQGARLAVIDTYIKFEYLINQTVAMNAIHVGVHRMYDDTEWVSATTGSTLTTTPWAPGNPSGAYDCVLAGYSPRGLRNGACSSRAYYVCEIPVQGG